MVRNLLLVSSSDLGEMLSKGNVWYVRHYEAFFDHVFVTYLVGRPHEAVRQGRSTLLSVASGHGNKWDLLFAPYRLWRLARRLKITDYLTADLVYSWWATSWLRRAGARFVLMPVCMPEQIYANTGRSMSWWLPIWLERRWVRRSFRAAWRVLAVKWEPTFVDWLSNMSDTCNKLVVVDTVPDALPSLEFFETLRALTA